MSRRDSTLYARLRRSWVRLGLMTAGGACVLVLVTTALLHEPSDLPRPKPTVVVRAEVPAQVTASPTGANASSVPSAATPIVRPRVVLEPAPRKTPTSVKELYAQDATVTPAELTAWIHDEKLDAQVRYCALRRLEQADAGLAVGAALEVLDDVTPLVRLNAIALLTRANDPRATSALEKLDQRSRLMAQALTRRRGS